MNILGLSKVELEDFFRSIGEKPFRGRQVYTWLYRKRMFDFERMTDLSQAMRDRLREKAAIILPRIDKVEQSADGFTRKFRLVLEDGSAIESVLMKEGDRITLCVSTQVGCALGCRFCATARMGFRRNLTAGEIIGQYLTAANRSEERITNIVLMGMGEPLLNYENTAKALALFTDGDGIALSSRRITLSTVGIIPGLERMTVDRLPCKLAVSLNAPDDELRSELMPIARKYPLKELLPALHRYEKSTRHRVTFEYVLLGGVNDSPEQAKLLKRLLGGFTAKLNLIGYNPFEFDRKGMSGGKFEPKFVFRAPAESAVRAFADSIARPGLTVMVRKSKGGDISAACGQLCVERSVKV